MRSFKTALVAVAPFFCLLFLISCGSGSDSFAKTGGGSITPDRLNGESPGLNQAFIVTTDRETGMFATIDLATRQATVQSGSIHSDAVATWYNGMVFVLNRFGQDNLQILDPSAGFATVGQFSTGNGTNPHDIAFVSPEKAYITLYGSDRILMMNPLTGEILGEIDLSSFADADGTPEVDALHLIGSSLFASVQRLDRNNFFAPLGSSIVLVIDTVTDMVIRQIPVEVNPFTDFVELPDGNLLLGSPGEFGVLEDGGINLIDTGSHTNTVVISDAALGGDVTDIVMIDDSKGYAIVTDESFNTHVVSFDLDTRSKLRTVMEAEGFSIVDLAVNSAKEVYVSYRKRDNPGIRIIDGLTDQEITAAPIDVGLPPNQTLFLE